jgi:hypothetical protein
MGISYKNFWSLNTDEAVVSGILRGNTNKDIEILMPMNAQMKGVDLILMNIKTKKSVTIQVKGSRAYEPQPREVKKYGHGSGGWFFLLEEVISKATADYFAFLIYVLEENDKKGRRIIEPHIILIPTKDLQTKSKKYKNTHGSNRLSYKIWVNPETKKAFDFRDELMDLSKYLDDKGFLLINKKL